MSQDADLQPFADASQALYDVICTAIKTDRGIHIETAITAAGYLAGAGLLRESGVPLGGLEPGSTVLADAINELGPAVIGFMSHVCAQAGVDNKDGWAGPIPPRHTPHRDLLDLLSALEPAYGDILARFGVAKPLRVLVAPRTAVQFIRDGQSVLDPGIAKALAATALVRASKTVPPPLATPSLGTPSPVIPSLGTPSLATLMPGAPPVRSGVSPVPQPRTEVAPATLPSPGPPKRRWRAW